MIKRIGTAGSMVPLMLVLACSGRDDPFTPPGNSDPVPGVIRVEASSAGDATDPNGYLVSLDGGAPQGLSVNGAVTFTDVAPGPHTIDVSDVAGFCSVGGDNSVDVNLANGAVGVLGFGFVCELPEQALVFAYTEAGPSSIWISATDASKRTRLTYHDEDEFVPQWSPDGTEIAFIRSVDGVLEAHIMNADGGFIRRVAPGYRVTSVDWSPDGTRLVVRDPVDGLTTMSLDGSDRTVLYDDVHQNPMWSPDGSRIAFEGRPGEQFQIMLIDPDGQNLTQITDTEGRSNLQVDWSPDGSRLVYYSFRDAVREVYVMNADGTDQIRLTTDLAGSLSPAWSTDGEWIVFVSGRSGNRDLWVMRPDGTEQTRITDTPGDENTPDWN